MNPRLWPFALGLGTELSHVAGAPLLENPQRFAVFTLAFGIDHWQLTRRIILIVRRIWTNLPMKYDQTLG